MNRKHIAQPLYIECYTRSSDGRMVHFNRTKLYPSTHYAISFAIPNNEVHLREKLGVYTHVYECSGAQEMAYLKRVITHALSKEKVVIVDLNKHEACINVLTHEAWKAQKVANGFEFHFTQSKNGVFDNLPNPLLESPSAKPAEYDPPTTDWHCWNQIGRVQKPPLKPSESKMDKPIVFPQLAQNPEIDIEERIRVGEQRRLAQLSANQVKQRLSSTSFQLDRHEFSVKRVKPPEIGVSEVSSKSEKLSSPTSSTKKHPKSPQRAQ